MRRLLRLCPMLPAALVALSGCTNPTAAFDARMEQFIGKPEVDVVQQLGVPTRATEAGGLRFIEYKRRRTIVTPGNWGWRWGPAMAGDVDTRICRVTFTLRNDKVERFDRRGDDCILMPGDPL